MSRKKPANKGLLERISWLVNDKTGGNNAAFAKNAGIPSSTFYEYINGRMPHVEHLIRICEIYSVNLNWLLTGQGPPYIKEGEQPAPANVVEMQHMDLIRGFKDKQRALNINRELMELEKLDPEMFQRVESYIKGTVDTLKEVAERKARYGPDRRQGERRKSDSPQGPPGSLERRKGRDRRKIA